MRLGHRAADGERRRDATKQEDLVIIFLGWFRKARDVQSRDARCGCARCGGACAVVRGTGSASTELMPVGVGDAEKFLATGVRLPAGKSGCTNR